MSKNATGRETGTEAVEVTLVTATEAAKALDLSSAGVRKMAERGDLPIAQKLPGRLGMYLFRQADVDALAAKRRTELEQKLARLKGAAS